MAVKIGGRNNPKIYCAMSELPWDEKIKIRDGWKYYPNGGQYGPMPDKFKK